MSKLAQRNGDDYPDAAEKHLHDARLLLQARRFDGAAYLSGYVVECVYKAFIVVEKGAIATGDRHHHLTNLSQSAIHLGAMPGARTAKYPLIRTAGHSLYAHHVGWRETIRYCRVGVVTSQQAADWFAEAKTVYDSAIIPMKLDGLI
jgi:hypothetical protein